MKKLAFTLTEILIALGIIGVMMALAVSIVKPREIQYKYQFQQAQTTLSDSVREAILRTKYTHHRFPKETINNTHPVMQLCQGLNDTLNTTRTTEAVPTQPESFGVNNRNGCVITTLNGMRFYIEANDDKPYCRTYRKFDDDGNEVFSMSISSYIAYVDLDGRGSYYGTTKDTPASYNQNFKLGNLPAFFIDEDYSARPVLPGAAGIDGDNCNL